MYRFLPLTKGHPSWKATFLVQKGWPHKEFHCIPILNPHLIAKVTLIGRPSCKMSSVQVTAVIVVRGYNFAQLGWLWQWWHRLVYMFTNHTNGEIHIILYTEVMDMEDVIFPYTCSRAYPVNVYNQVKYLNRCIYTHNYTQSAFSHLISQNQT